MKKQWTAILAAALLAAAVLAGCSSSETESSNKATSKARVEEIHADKGTVVLNHEEIPGLMMAMTMEFRLADPKLLDELKVGDAVEFDVERRTQGLTVVAFRKIHPGMLNLGAAGAYEGKAKVFAVNPAASSIALIVTDIPGIPYDPDDPRPLVYAVDPPSLLEGLKENDVVEVKLEDRATEGGGGQLVVTRLKKVEE